MRRALWRAKFGAICVGASATLGLGLMWLVFAYGALVWMDWKRFDAPWRWLLLLGVYCFLLLFALGACFWSGFLLATAAQKSEISRETQYHLATWCCFWLHVLGICVAVRFGFWLEFLAASGFSFLFELGLMSWGINEFHDRVGTKWSRYFLGTSPYRAGEAPGENGEK